MATPLIRPRCTLRCFTFFGINIVATSVLFAAVELRRFVVLAGPALDLFFLGEEALELGIGFLD
ncbi:MAG: hypothetical protein IH629_06550, partial [Thermoleophilia bacterium]|nr:hypothetical protein [Thermoleophilia bacterium]